LPAADAFTASIAGSEFWGEMKPFIKILPVLLALQITLMLVDYLVRL
jgi:hypothetical protein